MTKFFIEEDQSIYSNWFRLRAAMLFPDNSLRQKQAYDYLHYRFLIKHRNNEAFDFGKIPYKKIAIRLSKLIGKKKFLDDMRKRKLSSNVAGMFLHLLFSMRHYDIPEPGINKAKSLYSWRYADKQRKAKKKGKKFKFNISKTYADQSRKDHRDALPYCAAHIRCCPTSASSAIEFERRLDRFLALAYEYKEFCLAYEHAKDVGKKKLVSKARLLNIVHSRTKVAVDPNDIKPYSVDLLYKYLLYDYENQLEEKMIKPTDVSGLD